ncbi:MAG: enoyl-CoA hydratase [Deltaproteobacteria bacterium]|nr:enoyl-CoA hydratase [Deltaproteobacteria bacterium]MBW1816508.1 enoyl-CoA hydratase [Deltaproteobacteria bacterium]
MTEYETLVFEEKDSVAWIRMNRPDEMNALNLPMARELCQATAYCTVEKSIRAVVLTGTGKAFCAGGDVKDMARELTETGRSDLFLRDLALHLHSFVAEVARMPKPVMAAVNGTAAGAGFSMSLACDMSIAVEGARFVMAYTNIGLVPDGSSTYYLNRLVGPKKAMEIVYLNEPFDADEALRLGMVNRVLPARDFEKGVADIARKLAQGPTETYGRAKALMRLGHQETLESQMENERQGIALSSLQGEFREGVTAFIEKRKADFISVS